MGSIYTIKAELKVLHNRICFSCIRLDSVVFADIFMSNFVVAQGNLLIVVRCRSPPANLINLKSARFCMTRLMPLN